MSFCESRDRREYEIKGYHRIFAEAGITDLIFTGTTTIRKAMFTSPAVPLPQISTEKTRPIVAHFDWFQRVGVGASGFSLCADQHVKVRGSLSTLIILKSITAISHLCQSL